MLLTAATMLGWLVLHGGFTWQWAIIGGLAIGVIITWCYKPYLDIKDIIATLVSGEGGGWQGLILFLTLSISLSWTADYLREGFHEGKPFYYLKALSALSAFGITGLLFIWLNPSRPSPSSLSLSKVPFLILPLSNHRWQGNEKQPDDLAQWYAQKVLKEGDSEAMKKTNWAVPALSLQFHKEHLESLLVVISPQSQSDLKLFKAAVHEWNPKVVIYGTDAIDFNNYEEVFHEVLDHLHRIQRQKRYSDQEISINISGGTSIVTAALTIIAVREGRQVEYVDQQNGQLRGIDVKEDQVRYAMGRLFPS